MIVLALKYDDEEVPTEGDDLTKVLKLQKVIEAAALKVFNKSSVELLNLTYDNCNNGGIDAYDGKAEETPWVEFNVWDFPTTATYITFEIKLSGKIIKLKTVEPIILENYYKTSFTFTNKTEVINVETGDKTSIRKVIGLSSLTVVNETTVKLSDITYSQQKTDKSFVLSQGEKWEVEFNKQVEDYLSFKIQDKQITVKTAGKISINAGEEKIFKITKDTSVIPSDIQEATTVHKVIHAAKLEITNGSSAKLCNVKYGNRTFGDLTIEDEGDYINSLNYYELASTALPIFFEVQTPKRKVKVKTEETIKLNENDNIDFTIKDTTRVIIEETGKTVFIRNILGINELKIINQTSANKISKLTFADKTLEDLPKGDTWTIEFNAPVENNLFFVIKTEVFEKPLEVSTKEKIQLINEDKTFTITDDTLVILKGVEHALKLSDILNSAGLLIYNESDFGMHNINYGGPIFKYIPSKYHNGFVVWGAEIERYPISFQIFSNTIQLTTRESFEIQPKRVTEIHIKNSTLVEYEGNVVELGSFLNQTYKANGVVFEMRRIDEVKDAVLGSNGDNEFDVSLSAYSIGRTEVTQGLWEAVMGSNPSSSNCMHFLKPVHRVKWFDCIKFCNKLTEIVMGAEHCVYTIEQTYNGEAITAADFNKKGFRLPTSAEWEYAAMGGTRNIYAGCNTEEDLPRYAWYEDNSDRFLNKVGTRKPNGYGLYDMSGNIAEMCWDYNDSIGGNDPIGECLFPIYKSSKHLIGLRGGCFSDKAEGCVIIGNVSKPIHNTQCATDGLRLVCRP